MPSSYCFRGEWGFQLSIAYAKGDVVTYNGLFWQCVTAGATTQPGTSADWAPLGNGQTLGLVQYNGGLNWTMPATAIANAAPADSTNLAITGLRVPSSGRALVTQEAWCYVTAAANANFCPLSSTSAGSFFTNADGLAAYGKVIANSPADTTQTRRRASVLLTGLTPGAALSVYFGGWCSVASTGHVLDATVGNAGPALLRVEASP